LEGVIGIELDLK